MKFNWGTGITIFILLFLGASAVFITFAMRQEVDLVHEDYYERGTEHTGTMDMKARSAAFAGDIHTRIEGEHLLIGVQDSLAAMMDSARFQLYRPSDARLDLKGDFDPRINPMALKLESLSSGRYVLIFNWQSRGLPYEIQQTLHIP